MVLLTTGPPEELLAPMSERRNTDNTKVIQLCLGVDKRPSVTNGLEAVQNVAELIGTKAGCVRDAIRTEEHDALVHACRYYLPAYNADGQKEKREKFLHDVPGKNELSKCPLLLGAIPPKEEPASEPHIVGNGKKKRFKI